MSRNSKSSRAFTLFEVLIAIALILALLGTLYGFLFDMLSARAHVLNHVRRETAASALIKQLDADLLTCIVGDATIGGGVRGDDRQLRVLTRSVSASLASRGVDDPDVFGDLQVAEYRFDPGNSVIQGRRGPIGRDGVAAPEFSPLEGEIHRVQFRYYDGKEWLPSFDSATSNHLPVAVEVSLWYQPMPPDIQAQEAAEEQPKPDLDETDPDALAAAPAVETPVARPEIPASALPPPDRVRVIIIPDAGSEVSPSSGGKP